MQLDRKTASLIERLAKKKLKNGQTINLDQKAVKAKRNWFCENFDSIQDGLTVAKSFFKNAWIKLAISIVQAILNMIRPTICGDK